MSSDRTTDRPPKRPSTKHFIRSGADSKKVDEAQARILDGLRTMIMNLVGRAFDDAREIVRGALLHSGLDLYHEGKAHGSKETAFLYRAYLSILDRKYSTMIRDPRAEVDRPPVTSAELRAELEIVGQSTTLAEIEKKCVEVGLPLSTAEDE